LHIQRLVAKSDPILQYTLYLATDEILPRVCSLAEHSLDRSTKVAACELLHATLMIMIGNSAFQARGGKEPVKSPYHRLYLKIFPILLRLAVNTDQTIRDIIRPLLSQMIHWLTNNAQYENPETIALLNTCIDGVCDVNGTLQDYSAQCLHEFVKWSIKQTDVKVLYDDYRLLYINVANKSL
jgi:DNA-dependent protein kinase catalytic subunit